LPYYLDYNKDLQNIAASFVNGTAELGLFITVLQTAISRIDYSHLGFTIYNGSYMLYKKTPPLRRSKLKYPCS